MSKHIEQWNHNTHFHKHLLRYIPSNSQSALDIGCGLGLFARKLAQRVVVVDAIDADRSVVTEAERNTQLSNVRYAQSDFITSEMPRASYDAISAIASIHHMDMRMALEKMKSLLQPAGTLIILGLYRERTLLDHIYSWVSVPINYAYLRRHEAVTYNVTAPTRHAQLTLKQIRDIADEVIPGHQLRRHLFWRYSLVWYKR